MKFDTRAHCCMLITILMCNFSKYLPFLNFCGNFHPKIGCSPCLLKFSIEIRCNSVNMEKTRWNEICPKIFKIFQIYPKLYEWQKLWKNKRQNRNKHKEIYLSIKFLSIWRISDFATKFAQKYEWKEFWKNKYWNYNKRIALCPSTKFQSIWRNPVYGTKFAKKTWMRKILEK